MLAKACRLKSPGLFKRTLAGKRFCSNRFFTVFTLRHHQPQPKTKRPQFGIVISKKVDKRAAVRNKIKRRLREIIRTHLLISAPTEALAPYRCVVIIVRHDAVEATYQQLDTLLTRCFNLNNDKPVQ
ncbi:MAG: ribonuclease P protein component [Vampirovibrio sp.]|nr:ribonuclease P protein component [Vampirovibrio sp.]